MTTSSQNIDTKPQISVIIPVYKDADGLRITLESLTRQTLDKQQYEIIVANDGGSDEICNICNSFGVKYVNIVPNQGSYNARNKAMEVAQADAFAFVDADIEVPEAWLVNGLHALEKADYVAGSIQIMKKANMTLAELFEYHTAFDIKKYINQLHFGVTGNLFVKGKVFDQLGKFNSKFFSGGDFEFGNRVFERGFNQTYDERITSYHPPRGHKKYVNKIKRVCKGRAMITREYNGKYPIIEISLLKSLYKIIIPPNPMNKKLLKESGTKYIALFFYKWYIDIIYGYYMMIFSIGNIFASNKKQ